MRTEELLNEFNKENLLDVNSMDYTINFANYVARYHVNKALMSAANDAYVTEERTVTLGGSRWETIVEKDSIINAYPVKKIK